MNARTVSNIIRRSNSIVVFTSGLTIVMVKTNDIQTGLKVRFYIHDIIWIHDLTYPPVLLVVAPSKILTIEILCQKSVSIAVLREVLKNIESILKR